MRFLIATLVLLTIAAVGCALLDWELPAGPVLGDIQGSSDDYTQSKWARKQSR